jgi:surface antigen
MKKLQVVVAVFVALAFVPTPSPAEPPPWAKAHGWRKKNDPDYVGYTGRKWEKDYGVLEGKCDSAQVGTVLGGVVGGAIGSQVGKDANRPVAIVVGAVIGAVLGSKIGAEVDNGDRGCMGHALELAGEKKPVRWTNSSTGLSYTLTPMRNFGDVKEPCREFTAMVAASGRNKHGGEAVQKGVACRKANGEWVIRS